MRKILSCLFLLLIFSAVSIAVPGQISFQGVLKDSSGTPVTGTRSITFAIYISPTGGTDIWHETQAVSVEAGLYNVQLGSGTALTASIFDGNTKYLGLTIGSNELLPRVMMVCVPYAYRASYADTAGSSSAAQNAVIFAPPTQQTTSSANAIWIRSTASAGATVSIESDSDYAIQIGYANNRAIDIKNANGFAVAVRNTSTNAFDVQNADTGVHVANAHYGLMVDKAVHAGVSVGSSEGDGVRISYAGNRGVYIVNAIGNGVDATSTDNNGVRGATNGVGMAGGYFDGSGGTNSHGVYAQASGRGYSGYFNGGQGLWIMQCAPVSSGTQEGTLYYNNTLKHFYGFANGTWRQLDN